MARFITAEEALAALFESLVSPALAKVRLFAGAKAAERDVSNQMEAVAWLYNRYLCQEIPNLKALDWEDICKNASAWQPKLSRFLGTSEAAAYRLLTPTEQKVKSACEAVKTLRASSNGRRITKVCVCLLNFRQDKCVLVLGATRAGLWSFIEKNTHVQPTKHDSDGAVLSDEEFAFQAVEEQTGIKTNVLQLEGSFLVNDDLNEGSTQFYIMSCSGTFDLSPVVKLERIAWVSLDIVFSKAQGLLIDTLDLTVQSTPAVQYFHLRPFCSCLESWLIRQKDVTSLDLPKSRTEKSPTNATSTRQHEAKEVKHAVEHDVKDQAEKSLDTVHGIIEEMSYQNQEEDEQRQLQNLSVGTVGLNPFAGNGNSPQLSIGSKPKTEVLIPNSGQSKDEHSTLIHKQEELKQRQANLAFNTVVLETPLLNGSPQSATLLRNRTELSALRNANDVTTCPKKHVEEKVKQMNQMVNAVSVSLNVGTPSGSPQSSRIRRREEEQIVDKDGALLTVKKAYRSVRKRRKVLAKELRDHTLQADELYKQIEQCDATLVTLMGGGKAGLQLAIEVCKKDCEKQTSSLDVKMDCSQADAHSNCLRTERTRQVDTNNNRRSFQMLKSSILELNEVCAKNQWPVPSYGVFMYKNNQGENVYSGKVRIRNGDFELSETGEVSVTAKRAKLSAAAYMLSTLHLLRARNVMI